MIMNYSEEELERTLRGAPQPTAPDGLEEKLIAEIPKLAGRGYMSVTIGGWLRR